MKTTNAYTFIISRNHGRPITLHLEAWRLLAALSLAGLVAGLMAICTILFFFQYPRLQILEHKVEQLERERNALQDQVSRRDQDYYRIKTSRAALAGQHFVFEEGAAKGEDGSNYTIPVTVSEVVPEVDGLIVKVRATLTRQGEVSGFQGGYLFFVLENGEVEPPEFLANRGKVNERGFPEYYKAGIPFSLLRSHMVYTGLIRRASRNQTFSHLSVIIFSLRGGLLMRERVAIDRNLFLSGSQGLGGPEA